MYLNFVNLWLLFAFYHLLIVDLALKPVRKMTVCWRLFNDEFGWIYKIPSGFSKNHYFTGIHFLLFI